MLKVEQAGLLGADLAKGINLFTGAGFSTLVKNGFGRRLPTGDELKNQLIGEFNLREYSSLDLTSIYAILLTDRKLQLRKFLEDIFSVKSYDSKYDALRNITVDNFYTTNIDDLAFYIFDSRPEDNTRVLHDRHIYGAPRRPADVVQYVPLHGCVRHADDDFLFTAGQISSAFASDRETWYVFQREIQSRPTFFLGYSMRDAGVLQSLHDGSSSSNFNRWILLRSEDKAADALYKSLGFNVIVGSVEDFLVYISNVPSAVRSLAPGTRARLTGRVPSAGEIAQRPVRTFFLGSEPEWSDAYSNQVIKRRANSALKNSIFSGKHAALVGLLLSGKTTILKQVAADIATDKMSLFFDRISEPMAEKIISEHKNDSERIVVFVDNMIDSRDAIDMLVSGINAQIVCAEQSVYFDSISLKLLSDNLDVHSSSEISGQELQSIISSIPSDIRRRYYNDVSKIESDIGEIGLFEAFRRHVLDENLTIRFRAKLAEFERRDPDAFDVYIMACYVAACRSIVSFDMIYMFCSMQKKTYQHVYAIISRINSFLSEIELADDPHQEYFSVRSHALATIALKECPRP